MLERLFRRRQLTDPAWYQFAIGNAGMAPLWAVARVYLGWQWLQSGWGKITGDGWINQDGRALQAFWERITQMPEQGRPPITYGWYRDFIQFMLDNDWYTWFAWVVAFGEVIAGLALIVGLLTGFAALGGAFLNFNFMLAGTASTNPVLFAIAILILLAWKVAGHVGLDRWALPLLGTPWQPGTIFEHENPPAQRGRKVAP